MNSFSALVVLALVAGCLAQDNPEEDAKKCMSEVGAADKEELEKDEVKRKCFLKCMLVAANVMDADGTPNTANAEKMAEEKISDEDKRKKAVETFNKCADETKESKEENACEKGSIMFQCLVDNSEELREMLKKAKDS